MAKKSRVPKEFAEDLFKYIYDSQYNRGEFEDQDDIYVLDEDVENLLAGSRSYNEVRNRLINAMKQAGNNDIVKRAVTKYNNVYGDPESGAEGLFSTDLLPPVDKLKMRAINNDGLTLEESLARLDTLCQKLGVDPSVLLKELYGETDPVTGMRGGEGSKTKFRNKVIEKAMQSEADARKFYRDMGYVYDGENNDDYVIGDLYDLVERAQKRREYDETPIVEKALMTLTDPYGTDKISEGREPTTTDKVFSAIGALGDIGIASLTGGMSLPLQVIAGLSFGTGLKPLHDAFDLKEDRYVYSNGDGDKDIKADEKFNILKELNEAAPNLLISYIGGGILGGRGAKLVKSVTGKFKNAVESAIDRITGATEVKKKAAQVADDIDEYYTKLDDLKKMERQTTKEIGEINRYIKYADKAGTDKDRAFARTSRKRVAEKVNKLDAIYEAKTDVNNALKRLAEQEKSLEMAKEIKRSKRALSGLELLGKVGAVKVGESTRKPVDYLARYGWNYLMNNDDE